MQRLIFSLLIFLFSISIKAQPVYIIPWAYRQPKFVFPIYFEEGGGRKDTLYLGYDPNAFISSFAVQDSIFGVYKTHVDTNYFYVMWDNTSIHCGGILCSEVYRANVTSCYGFPSLYTIFCNKGALPLKIYWDKQLFYSDSLSFPSQMPSPRAEGKLYYGFSDVRAQENFNWVNDQGGFVFISDQGGQVKDSIVFYNIFNQPQPSSSGYLGLVIQPWGIWGGVSETNKIEDNFKIEVRKDQIFVESNKDDLILEIYDALGINIVEKKLYNGKTTIPDLNAGIYFAQLMQNGNFLNAQKFVVTK